MNYLIGRWRRGGIKNKDTAFYVYANGLFNEDFQSCETVPTFFDVMCENESY